MQALCLPPNFYSRGQVLGFYTRYRSCTIQLFESEALSELVSISAAQLEGIGTKCFQGATYFVTSHSMSLLALSRGIGESSPNDPDPAWLFHVLLNLYTYF